MSASSPWMATAPPRSAAIRTWVMRACGAACCNHSRRPGSTRSLSATPRSSAVASMLSPASAMCWPPASSSPSRRCTSLLPARPIRSRGASARQPPWTQRQRARSCRVSSCSSGRLPSASGAPRNCRPCRSASAVTITGRWSRRSTQALNSPVPCCKDTPAKRSRWDHARKSAGSADSQAWPSPRLRSRSRTAVSGKPWRSAQARAPTRRRWPFTRRRRSMRGSSVCRPSEGASTRRRPPITCSSPSRRSASSGSPLPAWGIPRTDQRPSSARSSARARPRRRSSVSEWPGSSPAYMDTSTSASPMAMPCPCPMRRPFSSSSGPRRVQAVSRWSKRTGWPARALSHAATLSGCRSANGSTWLTVPTSRATHTSTIANA
ncbi:hypothetical protein D3C71_1088130 [compost metagenome]